MGGWAGEGGREGGGGGGLAVRVAESGGKERGRGADSSVTLLGL